MTYFKNVPIPNNIMYNMGTGIIWNKYKQYFVFIFCSYLKSFQIFLECPK